VDTTSPKASSSLERAAFTVPEFCYRNGISRQKYGALKAEQRGPVEMRLGINTVRITAEAEREWQLLMQQPQPDIETKAVRRALTAGAAAAKSSKHVSKTRRRNRQPADVADQQQVIRELSARRRKVRKHHSHVVP
jgi:hypothetical protein